MSFRGTPLWVLAAALIVSTFGASAAYGRAAGRTGSPQIEDPAGDANFLNSQSIGGSLGLPFFGNHVTAVDAGSAPDIISVSLSHNKRHFIVTIATEGPLGPTTGKLQFLLLANISPFWNAPDTYIHASFDGDRSMAALLKDAPCSPDPFPVRAVAGSSSDGSGVIRILVPRAHCPGVFGAGATISSPQAFSTSWDVDPKYLTPISIDNTVRGPDYVLRDR